MGNNLRSQLTPLQTAGVVLFLIAVFLGGSVALRFQKRARERAQLRVATDRLFVEACSQRELLIRAIDEYKRKFGFYPPDHVISTNPLTVDAVTNQLLYELLGTVKDPATGDFSPGHYLAIHSTTLKRFFGVESIRNSVQSFDQCQRFLEITNISVYPLQQRPNPVGLIGLFPNWEGITSEAYQNIEFAFWRYNSSASVHNPKTFDLWIEVRTACTNFVVKNW
jgi:hypothetical protein